MWSRPGPAMESHLCNTSCFRCCSDFQIPSPFPYIPWNVTRHMRGLFCPCSQGKKRLKSAGCPDAFYALMWTEWSTSSYSGDCWAMTSSILEEVKLWHPSLQSMVADIHAWPQFYPHIIHPDSKPLEVDPLLSQHFHIPSEAHGNSCRQWGARTYILGSCILTYPTVSPVKLLQGHIGSNFSWS